MPFKDPEVQKQKQHEWYIKNKQKALLKQTKKRQSIRLVIDNIKKGLKCERCPENHTAVLDFHHPDPHDKDRGIAFAITNKWGLARLQKEIAKCIVLCSNCHRKQHWTERRTE